MGKKVRRHLTITGRVQQVGYRYFLKQQADLNLVKGWVKNCADGRVEAVLEGEIEGVERVVSKAEEGPQWARVNDLNVIKEPYGEEFDDFFIK